jgi:hypothetical protein
MGLESSLKKSEDQNRSGFKFGVWNNLNGFNGFCGGLLNTNSSVNRGIQIGAVSAVMGRISGTQISFLNFNRYGNLKGGNLIGGGNLVKDLYGFSCGLTNCADYVEGDQMGVLNIADEVNGTQSGGISFAKKVNGSQFNVVSIADEVNGVQIGGAVAWAEEGKYVQFGLLTLRGGDRPWYARVSPFFGFSTGKKSYSEQKS